MIGTRPSVIVTPIAKATEGRARKILTGNKASMRRRYEDVPTIAESKRGRSEREEEECTNLSEVSEGEDTVTSSSVLPPLQCYVIFSVSSMKVLRRGRRCVDVSVASVSVLRRCRCCVIGRVSHFQNFIRFRLSR